MVLLEPLRCMQGDDEMTNIKIKELSKLVQVPTETIRYYERIGLLPEAKRAENNYRVYGEDDVIRLRFIRNCRALDMNLDEIRELVSFLGYVDDAGSVANCSGVRKIVSMHLEHVQSRIDSLTVLKGHLVKLLDACQYPEPAVSCDMVRKLFAEMGELPPQPIQGVHTT